MDRQRDISETFRDGDLLLRETVQKTNSGETAKTRTYYFEPGTFKPIALDENGELYHYHLDHLGTPDTLTDSQGEIAWSVSYIAYGNLAIKHCNRIEQPIRFQGQYYDEETGLHYNRFRYYDPEVGAFTQQDPIGLLGGVNNYRYVPNPVGWVDPYGLTCKEIKPKTIPKGKIFEGTIYRYEQPDRISTTWHAHKWNQAANHRYTEPGISGVYGGTTAKTAEAEIAHYGALTGRELVSKEVKMNNILDITDPKVRDQLGVTLEEITGDSYDTTHAIGKFAKENGFDGILAPSARNPAGANLISFKGY
ncbi:RHS domain-containing protein [Microbulbifer thermotolerans]|uniref:RHS repeat-associated core domain-containing protein n=4 Tax=Microbulbifer thermotolerans TaxID=252514 RepID=UPI00224B5594|nr:RHS repeat-associated core domain-containing protein [Microbulbifer thermotolerans]MCX2843207.1 RHS domain-containing protein [Microbulbifer thermotolerans]